MLNTDQKHLPQSQDPVRLLYQRYGALLLGYISGMVNDRHESEEYLVAILSRFAVDYHHQIHKGEVSWLQLLQYSRKLLPELQLLNQQTAQVGIGMETVPTLNDARLSLLSSQEREIFCSIYYHGKSICDLAKTLKESESVIRSQFKLSFDKIRSARGN